MRLIDADKLIEKAYWHGDTPSFDELYAEGHDAVDVEDIENSPSVDAVPISLISRKIAEALSCPCNWTPLDEVMSEVCNDSCSSDVTDSECWKRVIRIWMNKEDGNTNNGID